MRPESGLEVLVGGRRDVVSVTTAVSEECGLQLSALQWLLDHHHTKAPERRRMVADLHFQEGQRILDLGCGPGLWASMFAEQVAPSGQVVGLDISTPLIDHALSRRAEDARGDLIHFALGDFSTVPFRDDTFDAAFMGNCLSYVPDALSVIHEMKRVTRTGGRVVSKEFDDATLIFHPIDPHLTATVLQAVTAALCKAVARGHDRGQGPQTNPDPFAAADDSVPHFDSFMGRKMHGMFLRSGLDEVSTTPYAIQKVPPLSPAAKRYLQGNGEWLAATAAPYLCEEDRRRWEAAFDPETDDYVLDNEDFYFCMTEMVTVGTVRRP